MIVADRREQISHSAELRGLKDYQVIWNSKRSYGAYGWVLNFSDVSKVECFQCCDIVLLAGV
jgi:hypothetical protein